MREGSVPNTEALMLDAPRTTEYRCSFANGCNMDNEIPLIYYGYE